MPALLIQSSYHVNHQSSNKEVTMQPIKIAIAGQANAGKTTLIRTLMKASKGEVGDRAGVTPGVEPHYFDALQAKFIDTPGFQNANAIEIYLDLLNKNPGLKMTREWESQTTLDFAALKAVKESEVVVYLATLTDVPKDINKSEISLIKKNNIKVVAVLNQYRKQLKSSNQTEVEARVNQWKDLFIEHSIDRVIIFDAHFDSPVKVRQIYDNILTILNDEQKLRFKEGLKRFNERQQEIRREACSLLASLIEDCREKTIIIPKIDFNKDQKKEAAKEQLVRRINGKFADFVYCVTDLYKVGAENPTTSKDELLLKIQPKAHWVNRISNAGGTAAILGGLGSFMSGILGAGFAFVFTGGVGTIAGGLAGAQVGGILGTAIGSLFIFSDRGDTVTIEIKIDQLRNILIKGVTIIWGLSNNGYGRDRKLSLDEARQLEEQICRIQASFSQINWATANKLSIIEYCEKILKYLEEESE